MYWRKKTYFEVDIGLVFSEKKNDFGADMEKRKN